MSENLAYIKMLAQYPFALRRLLRKPVTLEEARRIVCERMAHRQENFLQIVERGIYGYPASPYLPLLRTAGCEMGDVRNLVKQKGLEGALTALREAGVYISFEEFKGRAPIVRQGQEWRVQPQDFDNPLASHDYQVESGGSTGTPTTRTRNAQFDLDQTPDQMLTYAAHGLLDAPMALWRGILPDNSSLSIILRGAFMGKRTTRWFTHIGFRDSRHWVKYDLATFYVILLLRLYGVPAPLPEHVPMDQAIVIARWIVETLKQHPQCVVGTQVSRALRVALAAQEAGLDLTGATFMIAGEPPTPAKLEQIKRTGARHFTTYGAEMGRMAMGCANPLDGNDVHLLLDAFALIPYPQVVPGFEVSVPAFNVTSLLASAPRLMLNVQVDDYGIVEERHCGCALGELGFTTHLRGIHSYRKLTGEGVTMVGSEMIQIIEQVLPARFGGTPLDYQLREEEDERGFTRLFLAISPRLEIADEQQVIDVMMNALRASSPQADAARTVWQSGRVLQVKRVEPVWTARGKLMPLHIQRHNGNTMQE
jgi:hypothetical protein